MKGLAPSETKLSRGEESPDSRKQGVGGQSPNNNPVPKGAGEYLVSCYAGTEDELTFSESHRDESKLF